MSGVGVVVPLSGHHLLRLAEEPRELQLADAVDAARARVRGSLCDPPSAPGPVGLGPTWDRAAAVAAVAAVEARVRAGGDDVVVEHGTEPSGLDLRSPNVLRSLLAGGAMVRVEGAGRWCTPLAPLLDAITAGWLVRPRATALVGVPPTPGPTAPHDRLVLDLATGDARLVPAGVHPGSGDPHGAGPPLPRIVVEVTLERPGPAEAWAEVVHRAAFDPLLRADLPVGPGPPHTYAGSVLDRHGLLAQRLGAMVDAGFDDAVLARWYAGSRLSPGPLFGSGGPARAAAPPAFLDRRLHAGDDGTTVVAMAEHLIAVDAEGLAALVRLFADEPAAPGDPAVRAVLADLDLVPAT